MHGVLYLDLEGLKHIVRSYVIRQVSESHPVTHSEGIQDLVLLLIGELVKHGAQTGDLVVHGWIGIALAIRHPGLTCWEVRVF
jgi:hypothetical protein